MEKGIIIGAGIAGLTTAIALAKKGLEIKIYEQAKEINEIGAGIWVAPNGLKVYEELGLSEMIIKSGNALDKISIMDIGGKVISTINGEKTKIRHQFKTVAIHRGTLQKVLMNRVPSEDIITNKKFISYKQNNGTVEVNFEDGTTEKANFLILADGIHSKGRLQMLSKLDLRYSGQTCWRFVVNFDLPKEEENNMYEIWGNKKGLRVGYSKINNNQVYVFITSAVKANQKDSPHTIKEELTALCLEFPEIVKNLIATVNPEEIIRTDLFDFKPIKKWVDGRVALIGDAAHATTPNLGQGACQGIEDAYVIAQELGYYKNIEASFSIFEQKRKRKATYITNTSWLFAQLTNTTGLKKSFIKAALRATPNFINEKQLDKIYTVKY